MNDLYKLRNEQLRELCVKNFIKVSSRQTKRQMADKLYELGGGRYYKCRSGKNIEFIESRENPMNGNNKFSGPDWICRETDLTNMNNPFRPGCSMRIKPDMKCTPCVANKNGKVPDECRACVSGKDIFYCK